MISKLHATTREDYARMVRKTETPSPIVRNLVSAFLIGGGICAFGQLLTALYLFLGAGRETAAALCSVTLIFLSCLLTGLGLFAPIAKHAGAGTLVPITGFANAMTSAAMEFRSEGLVTGLGVKMFSITGPVLTYGLSAACLYGLIVWILSLF